MSRRMLKILRRVLMPSVFVVFGLCALLWSLPIAGSQETGNPKKDSGGDSAEDLFDALERSSEGFFDDREAELEALWTKMEAEEEAKWKRLEQEVLQKWDVYEQTSKKIWVDYSGERDAVSQANFESGKVVIEAVVPKTAADPKEAGKALIAQKAKEMVEKPAGDGKPVMQEMLPQETVSAVTEAKAEAVVDPKPIVGKDGVERVKVRVELNMVPDHIKKRAERYQATVEEEAHKRGVEPALVMAVMHTESAFNPMARSPVPAFGLMQLVPRFAAKEAYVQLYGKEKVLPPEYLYDPKNNIELGTTYMARLLQTYFTDVQDAVKRRYIAICAYNWGPTAMRKKLVDQVKIDGMKADELFRLLQKRVPNETKDYLQRVEERRALYGG